MIKSFLAVCLFGLGITGSVLATTVRPMLLDEIIDSSAIAFQGTCIGNRVERDTVSNFVVTYTTFRVRDVIKGDVAATHVIKQIGGILAGGESGMVVEGVPVFTAGEDYVVFLAGISSMGFSSPVGLTQGRFTIQQSAAGRMISNGADFRALTARMPRAAIPDNGAAPGKPVKQLGLEAFKQLARSHADKLE